MMIWNNTLNWKTAGAQFSSLIGFSSTGVQIDMSDVGASEIS